MHYEVNKSHHNTHWKIPLTSLMGNWTTGRKEYLPTLTLSCHHSRYFTFQKIFRLLRTPHWEQEGPPGTTQASQDVGNGKSVGLSDVFHSKSWQTTVPQPQYQNQNIFSSQTLLRIIMRYFVFWSGWLSSQHIKRWWVTEQIWWVSEAEPRQLMISR